MSELSGRRVVDNREAPVLLVRYECVAVTDPCGAFVLDAYNGPPMCVRHRLFLRAVEIVEGEPLSPRTITYERVRTPDDNIRDEIRYGVDEPQHAR